MATISISVSEIEAACGVTDAQVKDVLSRSKITEDDVMLPSDLPPALANAAARSVLGDNFEFSHLALGAYPIYRKA